LFVWFVSLFVCLFGLLVCLFVKLDAMSPTLPFPRSWWDGESGHIALKVSLFPTRGLGTPDYTD
jgi:hypothetical protein